MLQAKLETSDGSLVEFVFIPPFNPLPHVLIWGVRTFELFDGKDLIWRECFAYMVPIVEEKR